MCAKGSVDLEKTRVLNRDYKRTGDKEINSGREPVQLGWYEFAAGFCKGKNVLDVGCGMAEGLRILEKTARSAKGIDLDDRLEKTNVKKMDISEMPSKSVEILTCIDVIEHVEEDRNFVAECVRVASEEILISTPNYAISRCRWPYHVREYMPHQLVGLLRAYGKVEMFKGSLDGYTRYYIRFIRAYSIWSILRIHPVTGFMVRVVNHMLPVALRLQSSLFARIQLNGEGL